MVAPHGVGLPARHEVDTRVRLEEQFHEAGEQPEARLIGRQTDAVHHGADVVDTGHRHRHCRRCREITTRRLRWRPSSVAFDATCCVSPKERITRGLRSWTPRDFR